MPPTPYDAPTEPAVTASGGLPRFEGYEVLELVGRGGMGKVYRAKHVALRRTVAIKVMTQEGDERLLARFRDEARAVAKLQHPNIAQLFDTGTSDGRPYYSLEYADGGTLAAKWDGQPQDPRSAAAVVECVARAIQHSHDHGILHRDLKPGNVLLGADGTPKVADFGLAKELPTAAPGESTIPGAGALTRTGEVVGTPAYMPPEQASGVTATLTPAADVYSLGAVLYEGLTGRPPFQSPDALQTLFLVLSTDPVPPKTLQPKLPADLNTICLKCLEKQPRRRYPTAGELADDLRRFLAGEPIVARPVGRVERAVKWARRHKAAAALVAVSVVLLLALIGFGVWEWINAVRLREANDALAKKNDELARVNADLEKSKGETEAILTFALEKMDEYHFTTADKLRDLPQGETLRIEVLEQARRALDELSAANPTRQAVWEYLMRGYQRLGGAYAVVNRLEDAAAAYARSLEACQRLVTDQPDSVPNRAARATVTFQLANVQSIRGKVDEADRLFDAGEKEADRLEAAHPDDDAVLTLGLVAHNRRMMRAAEKGEVDALQRMYRRSAEINRKLARLHPDKPRYAITAVSQDLTAAGLLAQLKRYPEANDTLTTAKKEVDALPESKSPAVRQVRAAYHEAVANLHYNQDHPAEADAAYRLALAEYEGLVKDFPKSPNYRRSVVNTWFNIGGVWTYGGKPDVGKAAYTMARDLAAALVKEYPDDVQYKQLLAGIEQQLRPPPPEKP